MYVRTRRGLGDAASTAGAFGVGAGIATPIVTPIATSAIFGAGATSGTAAAAGTTAALGGLAVPVIGAALAGVTLLVTKLIANSGCGQTCIQATEYANQSATLMQQNMAAYFAQPAPRSKSSQTQALANFDALWAQLVKLCSDPSLGNAGKRCISERQPGGVYDDAKFNRDPIANDPNVVDDSQAAVSSGSGPALSLGSGSSLLPLALVGGLVLLAVAFS